MNNVVFLCCNMFINWILESYSLFMVLAVHCIDLETGTWSVMETSGKVPVFGQVFFNFDSMLTLY